MTIEADEETAYPIDQFAERYALTRHLIDDIATAVRAATKELLALKIDTERMVRVDRAENDAKEFREDLDLRRQWAVRALKAKRASTDAADSEIVETAVAWHVAFAAVVKLEALVMNVLNPPAAS
jgi:hypothetical protein